MKVKLILESSDSGSNREVTYNINAQDVCDMDMADVFDEVLEPVVNAVVEQKRLEFEREFPIEEDDDATKD